MVDKIKNGYLANGYSSRDTIVVKAGRGLRTMREAKRLAKQIEDDLFDLSVLDVSKWLRLPGVDDLQSLRRKDAK